MAGAGYTGGEMLRLLLNHDRVEILFVQSRSQAGKLISSIHTDLRGQTDLKFVESPDLVSGLGAIFLALPHGESRAFLQKNPLAPTVKIIDLAQDFRLRAESVLSGGAAPRNFVYGLPELNREKIRTASAIANPGCFATAMQLALLPLASRGGVSEAYVTGVTGSTGAGQKLAETAHFSYRANNISAYKTLNHQHIAEVEESLKQADSTGKGIKVSFVPWRGDFTRGIFVSAIVNSDLSRIEALEIYRAFYKNHSFVHVSDQVIDLKSVVNTNRANIEINQEGSKLAIHCAIDNLLKGASGQGLQNFNLMFGFPENTGLKLKSVVF